MLFERTLKIRLTGKPGFQRHIGDQLAAAQLIAGELDAPVDQKRVERHAVMLFEIAEAERPSAMVRALCRAEGRMVLVVQLGDGVCAGGVFVVALNDADIPRGSELARDSV